MTTQEQILAFLQKKTKSKTLDCDTDLFKNKLVDSLFALEIVVFVENTFHIKLKHRDITADNFSSVNKIAALVERTQGSK